MTFVKICGVTELDQVCWALEAGADMVGFVLAPSHRQLPTDAVAEILLRSRERFPRQHRPWQAVGVFANQTLEFVQRAAADADLDCVQLSGLEPPAFCRQLSVPVIKTIHLGTDDSRRIRPNPAVSLPGHGRVDTTRPTAPVTCVPSPLAPGARAPEGTLPAPSLRELLEETQRLYGAARLLLDSGSAGRWGGTGTAFPWETVGSAATDCLVAGGLTPENVYAAIAAMEPWGVDVSSGVERNGKKNLESIRRFVDRAKGGRHHGYVG